jgi:hypothetical protein
MALQLLEFNSHTKEGEIRVENVVAMSGSFIHWNFGNGRVCIDSSTESN